MRIGGGAGWAPVTGRTYHIKTMAVTPAAASGYTAAEIEQLFSLLEPQAVARAGKAHTDAAKTLASIADSLVTHAQALSSAWSGTAAQSSMTNFRQLHQTAITLAQASAQTGATLSWLGETILPFYKNYQAPANGVLGTVESWFGHNPQNAAAQQVMERLNDRLTQANAGLPSSVSVTLPAVGPAARSPATVGGAGSGGGAGAAAAGLSPVGGRGGAGVTTLPGGSGGTGPVVSPGGGGAGSGGGGAGAAPAPTHLAGLPPGGGGGTAPGVSPGPGGAPGGAGAGTPPGTGGPDPAGLVPPGDPGIPGGGAPGEGEPGALVDGTGPAGPGGLPGEGTGPGAGGGADGQGLLGEDVVGAAPGDGAVVGSDGMIGAGTEDLGAEGLGESGFGAGNSGATGFVGADDAATEAAADAGEGGLPVTEGSGSGRREAERHRQAWMAEDADIWAARPGAAVPPLISA